MITETKEATKRNQRFENIADYRLRYLLRIADEAGLYGTIGVRVKFEGGVAQLVEHIFEGKEKPGSLLKNSDL